MSSDVIARVLALGNKADELADKGHLLRAAEYYGRGAEAARALGADNLVAVRMLLLQGEMVCIYAANAPDAVADSRKHAARRAESVAHFSGAVKALERRRVADTLLEGKCSAAEVAWRAGCLQEMNTGMSAARARSLAVLVGYEVMLMAATRVLDVLANEFLFAVECSDTQFQSFAEHVVLAAELMQQPRHLGDEGLQSEVVFTELAGAWQRL